MTPDSGLQIFYVAQIRYHDTCLISSCVTKKPNKDGSVQHTKRECQCSFISVLTEDIAKIIQLDGIPLISVEILPYGKGKLHVEKATDRSSYIAISHVYSHGLGNLSTNSLPQCQVERLSKDIKYLPDPVSNGYQIAGRKIDPLSLDPARLKCKARRG